MIAAPHHLPARGDPRVEKLGLIATAWLRDASLTLEAFVSLGYGGEAATFLEWLLHSTRLSRPRLKVLYDVYGQTDIPETELTHLAGYRDSRPVRIGNAAAAQFQLDAYGQMIVAAANFARRGR